MGRAIVREPAVFLFDEPLSNLDAKLRVQMRLEIKDLQAKLGITSLYVTHDQVEAMTMADRMIVMNAGIAEQIGTPLDVYQKPRTLFAAQFIGSPAMNVVEGNLKSGTVTLNNGAALKTESKHSGDVMVGIRPEHLTIDPSGPIKLSIKSAEPLGANTLLHGQLDGHSEIFTASLAGVHQLSDTSGGISLNISPGDIHLFDRKSGHRLD
jgi:sn-glycerol 3-phosphate transport system ATP-binding protein